MLKLALLVVLLTIKLQNVNGDVMDKIRDVFREVNGIGGKITNAQNTMNNVFNRVNTIPTDITNKFTGISGSLNTVVSDIAKVPLNVKNQLTLQFNQVKGSLNTVRSSVSSLPVNVKNSLTSEFNGIADTLTDLPGIVANELESKFEEITDLFDDAGQVLLGIAGKMGNKFDDIDDVVSKMTDGINKLSSAFGKSSGKSLDAADLVTSMLMKLILDASVIPGKWIDKLEKMADIAVDAIDDVFSSDFPFVPESRRRRLFSIPTFSVPTPTTPTFRLPSDDTCSFDDYTMCDASKTEYTSGLMYPGMMGLLQTVGMMGYDDYPPSVSWASARKVYTNGDAYTVLYSLSTIFEFFMDACDEMRTLVDNSVTMNENKVEWEAIITPVKLVSLGLKTVLNIIKDFADMHDGGLLANYVSKIWTDQDRLAHNQQVLLLKLENMDTASSIPVGSYVINSTQTICAIVFVGVLFLIIIGLLMAVICMLKPNKKPIYSKINQTDVETDIN